MQVLIGIALWALVPGFIAKNKGRNFWGYYFLSFLITPLITMIITLCLKRETEEQLSKNTKTEEPKTNSVADSLFDDKENTEEEYEPLQEDTWVCKKCNAGNLEENSFCTQCGEKREVDTKPVDSSNADNQFNKQTVETPIETSPAPKALYCRKCGSKLVEDITTMQSMFVQEQKQVSVSMPSPPFSIVWETLSRPRPLLCLAANSQLA